MQQISSCKNAIEKGASFKELAELYGDRRRGGARGGVLPRWHALSSFTFSGNGVPVKIVGPGDRSESVPLSEALLPDLPFADVNGVSFRIIWHVLFTLNGTKSEQLYGL